MKGSAREDCLRKDFIVASLSAPLPVWVRESFILKAFGWKPSVPRRTIMYSAATRPAHRLGDSSSAASPSRWRTQPEQSRTWLSRHLQALKLATLQHQKQGPLQVQLRHYIKILHHVCKGSRVLAWMPGGSRANFWRLERPQA